MQCKVTFYNFLLQVVFEGIHGSSRANGFVGIDDIAYFEGDCTSKCRLWYFCTLQVHYENLLLL